jgi:hypothetical protein
MNPFFTFQKYGNIRITTETTLLKTISTFLIAAMYFIFNLILTAIIFLVVLLIFPFIPIIGIPLIFLVFPLFLLNVIRVLPLRQLENIFIKVFQNMTIGRYYDRVNHEAADTEYINLPTKITDFIHREIEKENQPIDNSAKNVEKEVNILK